MDRAMLAAVERGYDMKRRSTVAMVVVATALGMGTGCGRSAERTQAGPSANAVSASSAPRTPELEHAQNVLDSNAGFTSRAQAVALADQVALATAGRTGEERVRAAMVVGDLRRRAFRTFHAVTDAREAIEQYRTAGKSGDAEVQCRATLSAIALAQEVDNDPGAAYVAAYSAQRQDDRGPCEAQYQDFLRDLHAFRPDPGQLIEIDRKLASTAKTTEAEARAKDTEGPVLTPGPGTKAGPAKITSIESFSARDAARVVIHLTGPVSYAVGTIDTTEGQGWRLYVDLAKTKRGKAERGKEAGGLLERVRVGTHPDKTRVVLDLRQRAYRRVFFLPEPFRVIVDMSTTAPRPVQAPTTVSGARKLRRVVLDPGHGGTDPGATGPGGLREKDVTLDVAHRAAPILSRELGIMTMLTRDDDRYVPLEERAARANAFRADLFVSIHCNASEDPQSRGVQTFVLNSTADEGAMRVAARENAASAAAGTQLGAVLEGLNVPSVAGQSAHFAKLLQRATIASLSESYGNAPDGGVRAAAFFVLLGAQMPAALFETSFISNPEEESRLATADYRQKLANGLANAIRAYADGK